MVPGCSTFFSNEAQILSFFSLSPLLEDPVLDSGKCESSPLQRGSECILHSLLLRTRIYTRLYVYIYELDARIHIIVGICPLLRFVAALQKVGEGIISGFRGGRPAIRKLETRPGARYSVRGREGGELKQRDAGVRRRGREKEIRRERIGIPRVQGT